MGFGISWRSGYGPGMGPPPGAAGGGAAKAAAAVQREKMLANLQAGLKGGADYRDILRQQMASAAIDPTKLAASATDTIEAQRKHAMKRLKGSEAVRTGALGTGALLSAKQQLGREATKQQITGRREAELGAAELNRRLQQQAMQLAMQEQGRLDMMRRAIADKHEATQYYSPDASEAGGGGGGFYGTRILGKKTPGVYGSAGRSSRTRGATVRNRGSRTGGGYSTTSSSLRQRALANRGGKQQAWGVSSGN